MTDSRDPYKIVRRSGQKVKNAEIRHGVRKVQNQSCMDDDTGKTSHNQSFKSIKTVKNAPS